MINIIRQAQCTPEQGIRFRPDLYSTTIIFKQCESRTVTALRQYLVGITEYNGEDDRGDLAPANKYPARESGLTGQEMEIEQIGCNIAIEGDTYLS